MLSGSRIHCRRTNPICLKCGTLKEEGAPVSIKYSCDVFWGAYMCVFVQGIVWMSVCVCVCVRVQREKELWQIVPQAASNRVLTPRLAVAEKRGWAEGKKERGIGGRRYVCEERERGKEGERDTAGQLPEFFWLQGKDQEAEQK